MFREKIREASEAITHHIEKFVNCKLCRIISVIRTYDDYYGLERILLLYEISS